MAKPKRDSEKCEVCGSKLVAHETVVYGTEGNSQHLCMHCFNQAISAELGVDFEHTNFQPITLQDRDGMSHEFKFVVRLLGAIVSIEAYEMINGEPDGYQFSVIGDPEEDILQLFTKLYIKISQAMSTKHIEMGPLGWQITEDEIVRAHIDWDEDETGVPLLIIDGKKISWHEFGRMLTTFEGFNFKMEIFDKSEEC